MNPTINRDSERNNMAASQNGTQDGILVSDQQENSNDNIDGSHEQTPRSHKNSREPSERRPSEMQSTEVGDVVEPPSEQPETLDEGYSAFTVPQKRWIIAAASLSAFFSPLSSAIYYPALNTIAKDLNVTSTQINLTVTTYLIIQGVAPMMIAGFSDGAGRRPAYIICFTIYIFANLGLGLQNSFAALLVLRCIQSGGSSGTVALANGVVGDMITSQERGTYIAYASLGGLLGPSISPIIGGLITQYVDWHWVFWFLLILSAAFFVPLLLFLPETCRKVVGNGTIPPPKLNMSITDMIRFRNRKRAGLLPDPTMLEDIRKNYKLRFPNPLNTLVVLADKESALMLFQTGLCIACFYAVSTGASSQFGSLYGFNDIQIALMFIPVGVGGIISAITTGKLMDWNYRRHAKIHDFPMTRNVLHDLTNFPIEAARLQVAIPLIWLAAATIILYGWTMRHPYNLACPVILLFVMGYSLIAAFQVLNVLLVDIYPGRPATATAANNLVRCELGAAASAAIVPMINAMGPGWSYTLLALIFVAFSPTFFVLMRYGMKWRKAKKEKLDAKEARKREKQAEAENRS